MAKISLADRRDVQQMLATVLEFVEDDMIEEMRFRKEGDRLVWETYRCEPEPGIREIEELCAECGCRFQTIQVGFDGGPDYWACARCSRLPEGMQEDKRER